MPPRQDDDKMVISTADQFTTESGTFHSPASHSKLIDLPKDISFLAIQQPTLLQATTASVIKAKGCDAAASLVRQRMELSLEKNTQRAQAMKERMLSQAKYPFMDQACGSALVEDMTRILDQAKMLLEDAKKEDDVSQMTKNKRLSVALINVIQYLDTLETAMAFSSRDRLEAGIRNVLTTIADKCEGDAAALDPLKVCVSSWSAPSLAFDFQTGSPARLSLSSADEHDEHSMPLELEVKPIMEYTAEELVQGPYPNHADSFVVTIKKCTHELREYGARDGVIGESMVQVHIAPLAETKAKKEVVWGHCDDVEPLRIREVRATQQNAYPTKFRINFDTFVSSVYGKSGVTLTLNMETCQTMDKKIPKIQIELVVDP